MKAAVEDHSTHLYDLLRSKGVNRLSPRRGATSGTEELLEISVAEDSCLVIWLTLVISFPESAFLLYLDGVPETILKFSFGIRALVLKMDPEIFWQSSQ